MICDSCGYEIDPFGDDEAEEINLNEIHDAMVSGRSANIRSECPSCGHVQYAYKYGYKRTRVMNGSKMNGIRMNGIRHA